MTAAHIVVLDLKVWNRLNPSIFAELQIAVGLKRISSPSIGTHSNQTGVDAARLVTHHTLVEQVGSCVRSDMILIGTKI